MFDALRVQLRDARGSTLAWAIGLGLLSVVLVASYPAVRGQSSLDDLWSKYQGSLGDLFGSCVTLTDYPCFMDSQFLAFLPVIMGISASIQASRMLAGAEESGRLDLLLSTPLQRRTWVTSAVLAMIVSQTVVASVIAIILGVGSLIIGRSSDALPMMLGALNALPAALVCGLAAFIASAFAHRKTIATSTGTAFVLGSYFLGGLAPLVAPISWMKWLSIFHWYHESQPARHAALDGGYFLLSLGLCVLALSVSGWIFSKKDVAS